MTSRNDDAAASAIERAFAEQSRSLNLPVDAACDADTRAIGIAFATFKKSLQVNLAETAPAPSAVSATAGADASDAAIRAILQGYESLSPETFGAQWRNYATDPHMGVGTNWVGTIDDDAVDFWLKSESLAKAIAAFPPYSPRRVELQDVLITYIGSGRAAATYRAVEQHTNGEQSAGNAAAVLMNTADQGWRIVVVTKGGRGEA